MEHHAKGNICPHDVSKQVRVASPACWQCPHYRGHIGNGIECVADEYINMADNFNLPRP